MRSFKAVTACLSLFVFGTILAYGMESGKARACAMESTSVQQLKESADAPSSLKAALSPTGVRLEWSLSPKDPGAVTGYEIVRSTVISGPFDSVGSVGKGVQGFIDTTASPETIYFYKVRAVFKDAYSAYSKEAVVEVPGTLGN